MKAIAIGNRTHMTIDNVLLSTNRISHLLVLYICTYMFLDCFLGIHLDKRTTTDSNPTQEDHNSQYARDNDNNGSVAIAMENQICLLCLSSPCTPLPNVAYLVPSTGVQYKNHKHSTQTSLPVEKLFSIKEHHTLPYARSNSMLFVCWLG